MKSDRAVADEENQASADGPVKSSIDVVLAEGYPILLAGMAHLLASHVDVRVVAKCLDGNEALSAVRKHRPDVLVSDLRLPVRNGLLVLRDLTNEKLHTRVVLLADRLGEDEMLEAIRLGARGIMLKQMSGNLLVQCIRKVHAGERWRL